MISFLSTAASAGALGFLWFVRRVAVSSHRMLMRHGFIEVRVRGEGIDVTCRRKAYYWHAGMLNFNSTGWTIQFGGHLYEPVEGEPVPDEAWCQIRLQAERRLRAGITCRTDSSDPETRMEGSLLAPPKPYLAFGRPGVLYVSEASWKRVRGHFHLMLPRLQREEPGPPLEVEGRFEVRRWRGRS